MASGPPARSAKLNFRTARDRPVSDRPIVKAAGLLLITRNSPRKFLLMKHANRWDLPKGHAEPGESARQTALREMEEETGIEAGSVELDPDFRFLSTYPVRYPDRPGREYEKRLSLFLGWIDGPRAIDCTEHLGAEWIVWDPPHAIQQQAIDPFLAAVEQFLSKQES